MTDNNHPITPPPELVALLRSEAPHGIRDAGVTRELHLITAAYRAGADQELEACISAVLNHPGFEQPELFVELLRTAPRPKPRSLKEQALEAWQKCWDDGYLRSDCADTIRRALESLPE